MRVLRVAVYEGEMSKARERREGRREKGERGAGGRTEARESVRRRPEESGRKQPAQDEAQGSAKKSRRTEKAQENREKR